MDQDEIRGAIGQLVAAARLEGLFEGLCRLGEEDPRIEALLDTCEDGVVTARGLREVAVADLLALLDP